MRARIIYLYFLIIIMEHPNFDPGRRLPDERNKNREQIGERGTSVYTFPRVVCCIM